MWRELNGGRDAPGLVVHRLGVVALDGDAALWRHPTWMRIAKSSNLERKKALEFSAIVGSVVEVLHPRTLVGSGWVSDDTRVNHDGSLV